MPTTDEVRPMLRISGTAAAWALLAALGCLTLTVAVTGCGSQSSLPTAQAKPPESGPLGKTSVTAHTPLAGRTPQALPRELAEDLGNGVKLELLLIPAGEFLMGSPDSEKRARDDERPQHRVRITKPFYLGKYPVTQEQWEAVMGCNPSGVRGLKNPVESVSWEDCQRFCDRLNANLQAPGKFQLPSEAQWEYACRAGSRTRYCFGDDDSGLGEYAWNNSGETHPVGEKKPNAWGLYDMHGNVWEMCQDWYDGGYYANSPVDDPTGPASGSCHVSRGGSWIYPADFCRSAYRYGPGIRNISLGMRLALVPTGQ